MEEKYLQLKTDPEIYIRAAYFPSSSKKKSKTIVIIPGYFGAIEERIILAEGLAKNYNVIVYEPKGYGKSTKKRQKGLYTVENYAEEMREVLQLLELKDNEFAIFGSSLAVATMHQYTAYLKGKKPEPAAMIFVSPAPKYKQAGFLKKLSWVPGWMINVSQKILFQFMRITRNKEERKNLDYAQQRFVELDPWVQWHIAIESVGHIDFTGKEKDIPVPLCVFSAEKDGFTAPEDSQKYIHNPKSELILVDTDAHKFIQGKEDILVDHIDKFLNTHIWTAKLTKS